MLKNNTLSILNKEFKREIWHFITIINRLRNCFDVLHLPTIQLTGSNMLGGREEGNVTKSPTELLLFHCRPIGTGSLPTYSPPTPDHDKSDRL